MISSPLDRPVQVAYAVTDVHAAAARFSSATGAGPFFVVPHIGISDARVHGAPALFDHSSAYGQWGDLMVELVEEHTTPIVVPDSRVHHVAFMVPSLPDAIVWCRQQDWPEALWARTIGGQEFAFCDARAALGHLVELYEPSGRLRSFYEMVASAAAGWTGTDPVRLIG